MPILYVFFFLYPLSLRFFFGGGTPQESKEPPSGGKNKNGAPLS